jgi:hypothetical protein
VSRKSKVSAKNDNPANADRIECEPLDPVCVVERELTRPDGSTLRVQVPVYPPFQLKKRPAAKSPRARKTRGAW